MLTKLSEALNVDGVQAVSYIQKTFLRHEDSLLLLSKLLDPRYAFLIFCPLVFSLHRKTGTIMIFSVVGVEWMNQILKWLLMSERPYWWIHTSNFYNRTGSPIPPIKQFPITCETGPGSPSGHAMATAAVWFVLCNAIFTNYFQERNMKRRITQLFVWSGYILLVIAVSISRLYIAAHFPHQCILGAGLGFVLAYLVSEIPVEKCKLKIYLLLSLGMGISVLLSHTALKLSGVDPNWTVERALKYCIKRNWVHLDTTPYFSIMRYCGFFLGTGIGMFVLSLGKKGRQESSLIVRIISSVLSLLVCYLSDGIKIPSDSMRFFYSSAFALYVTLPIVFVAVIPLLVSTLLGELPVSKSKTK